MRGDYYLWSDEDNIHIWSRDGYDGWEETIWAQDDEPPYNRRTGFENASSVIDNARDCGNFGGKALDEMADALKAALRQFEERG